MIHSVESIMERPTMILWVLIAPLLMPALSKARITNIVIDPARSQSPTFEGLSFGAVGQYEKLRGTAFGELDPSDPRNAVITDIELAPRNARGKVEYSMDIFILKPIDLSSGNHRLFIDFNNRGQMRLGRLNDVALTNNPTTAADAGTGFIMNMGYTIVSNGWDFGASGFDSMKITVPIASHPDGSAITGRSYEYIVFDNATTMQSYLAYPAATLDKSQATLTVRARLDDPPTTVPASGWEYTSPAGTAIRLLPAGTPFQQSHVYEFTYTAKNPVVAAIGLAATRDFVSFLRHATAAEGNPLAGDVQHTFSYLHLAALTHLERLPGAGLQRGRRWPARHRRHTQPYRRRQRRSNQLSVRADRKNRAQPPEPLVPGRRVPLRPSGVDRSPQRQNRWAECALHGKQHLSQALRSAIPPTNIGSRPVRCCTPTREAGI